MLLHITKNSRIKELASLLLLPSCCLSCTHTSKDKSTSNASHTVETYVSRHFQVNICISSFVAYRNKFTPKCIDFFYDSQLDFIHCILWNSSEMPCRSSEVCLEIA
jgi:hypothetical protein